MSNVIERFKRGKKVQIILPNGKTGGEYVVGTNIRLQGEDFWRRVNSDGTLSKFGDGTNGTVHFNLSYVPTERNRIAKEYLKQLHGNTLSRIAERLNPVGGIKRTVDALSGFDDVESWAKAFTPYDWNVVLRNSQGNNKDGIPNIVINSALNSVADIMNLFSKEDYNQYYTGKINRLQDNPNYNYFTGPGDNNANAVNAFTYLDYTGFEDSPIGVGNYKNNPKYNLLPAYTGQFYADLIYLPTSLKKLFIQSNGRWGYFDKDKVWLPHDTYDAGNHRVQIEYINDTPSILFEDVFNTNNEIVDKYNYPFILNQRVPVIFTDDESKLSSLDDLVPTLLTMLGTNKNGITYYKDRTSIK